MSIPWMHGTIAKTKRMPGEMEQGFCMAEMPYKNHALFYIIGKLFELPYDIKSPLGRMRTQMQRKYVAEATHLRRRISQSEILFTISNILLPLSAYLPPGTRSCEAPVQSVSPEWPLVPLPWTAFLTHPPARNHPSHHSCHRWLS